MSQILYPLEWVVAWIMVAFHTVLSAIGMPEASGWTWALSIVGLVIVIRIILIPLFVKQIKASRGLQLIQPEVKKIQEKYKGKTDQASRQAMTQETMALYKERGTNPFASCLPILLQAPIFFALFRVLNGLEGIAAGRNDPIGPMTQELAAQAEASTIFGAQLSDTFLNSDTTATKILTVVLIILMSATTFTTQRQLMMKNMPASALDNPFAQQQKLLLYILPIVFAVSGVNFPIGVLIYWLTTNVWSMGQQFYVIRRMPAPGSPAEKALAERRKKRGKPMPGAELASPNGVAKDAEIEKPVAKRVQPKKQPRSKRTGPRPSSPPGAGTGDPARER
jgi:YidC/Oxa1 family membrane protein insertase